MKMPLCSKLVYARNRPLVGFIARLTLKLLCVEVPTSVTIGHNLILHHSGHGVVIHPKTTIRDNVQIFHGVTLGRADSYNKISESLFEGIVIEDNAIIGAGAKVLCGAGILTVGEGSVIGANAVLLKSTGAWEIWAGIPARCIGARDPGSITS